MERRGVGYVLAVACSHRVSTAAGTLRADTITERLPRRAWQRLSAGPGSKGPRYLAGSLYPHLTLDLSILTNAGVTLAPPPSPTDRVHIAEQALRDGSSAPEVTPLGDR